MSHSSKLARRAFLQRLGHLGIAGTAAPWALNLAAISDAAAFTGGGDYKALVCIFLNGGNDHGNTVIPYDSTSHAEYVTARGTTLTTAGGIVIARDRLAATALSAAGLTAGRQYALSPNLPRLKALYESGRLAVQMNVGPLVQPTTLAQYKNKSVPLPPKLFSHNDQQSVWQSSAAEGSTRGWGGQMGDLALASNGGNSLFTCMSVTGNTVFLSGDSALAYRIGTAGATAIGPVTSNMYGSATCRDALRTLITGARTHVLENELNTITRRSIDSQVTLSTALAGGSTFLDKLPTGSGLGLNDQLRMVARLIQARSSLGLNRQVFMVSMGGFDHHDNLAAGHATLMTRLDDAMAGFNAALDEIGAANLVTTFTASEFGRTITSNGDGSDHAWGAHHFVMGGAVKGKSFYGTAPEAVAGGPEDIGQGRYIPSTSVDQYAATMARWFGVSDTEMTQVAPSIGNFNSKYIGFL
ncbi:DUF1501 domain-containing protein [Ottowia sp.]|uniref:DUF1501 domain-containing protein n=1 Tax=Ottowia sp. TaxID=1898956 RepID=UPI0039E573E1